MLSSVVPLLLEVLRLLFAFDDNDSPPSPPPVILIIPHNKFKLSPSPGIVFNRCTVRDCDCECECECERSTEVRGGDELACPPSDMWKMTTS